MPGLPELIQALLDPKAYPDPSSDITLIQTGISLVFLAGDYVYKIKKPVNVGYLDYSTLEKRRYYCEREVDLNRRLCPSAYLGVVSVTDNKGLIRMGGAGETIEYAVKMRRLPHDMMLDALLPANQGTSEMLTRVAKKMAGFHKTAATNPEISRYGGLEFIKMDADENFTETFPYIGKSISSESYGRIKTYTESFIEANASLFDKRVAESRIRDCHGDLHAEHVCFCAENEICIYDCIEFNDRFRYCDVASEIAFLAMDLDKYGRSDLSNSFVNDYVSFSGDKELLKLLDFYKCYRAYVRGKVESFDANDSAISIEDRAKALVVAQKYFELAESYIK